ncbi:hypothetical protein J9303_04670 [Bacillaceae bacterium Marseille-Q3522]|nr:hypothetical protein [Bacillaceae bacterium Marseille-Q3522]
MYLMNYMRLLFQDCKKSQWRLWLCLVLLLFGVTAMIDVDGLLESFISIPDIMNYWFSTSTLSFLLFPLFLVVLSVVVPPMTDSLRIFRFQERRRFVAVMIGSIFITVLVFLLVVFSIGFFFGWIKSGSLDNPWPTKEGLPYRLYKEKIDLSLFHTGYMILRYTVTEFFSFLFLGLFTALLYLLIPRYFIVFFVVELFVILDGAMYSFLGFSFFIHQTDIHVSNWESVAYFIGNSFYLLGIVILLCMFIYITVSKKDFIQYQEEHKEQ